MPTTVVCSMPVKWRLRDVMERYRVTNKELGDRLGRHATAISRLRQAEKLPAIGSDDIEELADAISKLLHERGIDDQVTAKDLIGFE